MTTPGDPNFMTSFARGLRVIEAFNQTATPPSMADLARLTGLSRAAVRRCLYTLQQLGFATSSNGRYQLTPRILALGQAYLANTPLPTAAQPLLDQVSAEVRESCSLALLDGDDIVYIARASARRIMSVVLSVGSRLPAYCTAMGRVLLAERGAPWLDDYFQRVLLTPFTDRTITDSTELRSILAEVRGTGFALVDQELETGLRSLAVPIRDGSGTVVAAMNISAPARVSLSTMCEVFLPSLRKAALELEQQLRY